MTRLTVVDDDPSLATTVQALLSRDGGAEVRHVETLAEAAHALDGSGVLIAGPLLASKAGVVDLQHFHRDFPAVRIVLAFDRRPGSAMRDVVAVGAEGLVDPTDAPDLRATLDRALRFSREVVSLSELGGDETQPGRIVTVVSATGGCGKTFVSSNLGVAMAAWSGARVAVVDLDLQFGEIAANLGLRARTSWADLIGAEDDEIPELLDDVLVDHPSGVRVLAAPTDPAVADAIGTERIQDVLRHLRATHDVVIVDTSTGLSEATLGALDITDETVLLALLDVASIRNLRTLDRTLDRLQLPAADRRLVLNEDRGGVGLTADEVERVLDRSFAARIPFSDTVQRTINHGRPLLLDHPEDPTAGPLVDLLAGLTPEAQRAAVLDHRPDPSATSRRWWEFWKVDGHRAVSAPDDRPPVPPLGRGRRPAELETTTSEG